MFSMFNFIFLYEHKLALKNLLLVLPLFHFTGTFPLILYFVAKPTKWSNTQTIRRQIADKLFECVWPFCGVGV